MAETTVYLDYNATAPLRPEVLAAMTGAMAEPGNPSSVHAPGRRARRLIEEARIRVAALAGADPRWVNFTSGGTEANNWALTGLGRGPRLVSAAEHDSVLQAAPEARRLAVHADGRVDLEDLQEALADFGAGALVSVMLANNETGVLQPVEAVVELARAAGALVHCDAVQAAGKLPLDMARLGVDCMTLSAHKLGGPPGVGALICRDGVDLKPLLRGGGQESRRRAGTENLPGIAGFGAAAEAARRDLPLMAEIRRLRDRLEEGARAIAPDLRIFGAEAERLANTSCLALPGRSAETQVMALDLAGVAVSAGAACSSGKVQPSHVLAAMGAGPDEAASAIRVSLGWQSGEADVGRFLSAWGDLYRRSRAA